MNDLRLWVGVLALVCFLAGGAAGFLYSQSRVEPSPDQGPFADYAALFTEQFGLDRERERVLRGYLAHYQREVEQIRDRHTAELLSSMELDLRQVGEEYAARIHDGLLPPAGRDQFDRLAKERVENL